MIRLWRFGLLIGLHRLFLEDCYKIQTQIKLAILFWVPGAK